MEPIDYRQVLRRRWGLVLVLAVLGGIIGVLLPLHIPHPVPTTKYQTSALVGVTPGGGPPTLGQIDFFAAQQQVIVDAAKSAGIKQSPAALENAVTVAASNKRKTASPNGTVSLSVSQPTAGRSAKLTNAFVKTLAGYIQNKLNTDYQSELQTDQQNVCNLEAQVNSIDAQIAQIVAPNAPGANSGGATPPNGITCNSSGGSNSGGGGTSTSTEYFPTWRASSDVVLTGSSSSTTTDPTTTTAPTNRSTTTTTPSGPNSGRTNPQLADLQAQAQAVTQEYVTAVAKAQALSDAGAQQSGFIVLQPAQASLARVIPGGISILDHRSVRGVIGILGGGAAGIGIGMLLSGLDKTLRTARRAEETFGFPVVAEIPAPPVSQPPRRRRRTQSSPPPPVPVLTAPASTQAEAYRKLRMALELTPRHAGVAAAASAASASSADDRPNGHDRSPATAPVGSSAPLAGPDASAPLWHNEPTLPAGAVSPSAGAPAPRRAEARARRQPMLLVVAPATEPTRALVVANLAATYTESGLSVYIVTTENLRSHYGSVPPAGLFEPPSDINAEVVLAQSNPTQITGVRRLGMDMLLDGPGQLAASAHDVLAVCRRLADVVLVDAPSLLSTYDTETLVPEVDRVLVVGEAGTTTVDQARHAGALLERIQAPVVGVVLTNTPSSRQEKRAARKASLAHTARSRSARPTARTRRSALRRARRDTAAAPVTKRRTSAPKRHRLAKLRRRRSAAEPQREPR